jgi:hypothetical protein
LSFYRAHYPDPGITHGHFRVLPQTTGGFVIVDDRRAPGEQMIRNKIGEVIKWHKAADAGEVAKEWDERGLGNPRPPPQLRLVPPLPKGEEKVELLF